MIKKGMKLICAILMCLIVINIASANKITFARHEVSTGGGGGATNSVTPRRNIC